jgi:hypothetical protein
LYPRATYGNFAVFKFKREDVPAQITRESPGASPYEVRTEHDPEDDNYGHCETRMYRGHARMTANKVKPEAKNKLRLAFSRILSLERKAGDPFPFEFVDNTMMSD